MVTEKKTKLKKAKGTPKAGKDPGLREFFGIWKDVDTDRMIKEIHQRRHEDYDMVIAATAIRHELALVSRDKHFDRVPELQRA